MCVKSKFYSLIVLSVLIIIDSKNNIVITSFVAQVKLTSRELKES